MSPLGSGVRVASGKLRNPPWYVIPSPAPVAITTGSRQEKSTLVIGRLATAFGDELDAGLVIPADGLTLTAAAGCD